MDVDLDSNGLGAGVGVEYFVASNIAVGMDARYLTARAHTAHINNGPPIDGRFDSIAIAFTLRVFVASFGR